MQNLGLFADSAKAMHQLLVLYQIWGWHNLAEIPDNTLAMKHDNKVLTNLNGYTELKDKQKWTY